jgi:hypothetical protein
MDSLFYFSQKLVYLLIIAVTSVREKSRSIYISGNNGFLNKQPAVTRLVRSTPCSQELLDYYCWLVLLWSNFHTFDPPVPHHAETTYHSSDILCSFWEANKLVKNLKISHY